MFRADRLLFRSKRVYTHRLHPVKLPVKETWTIIQKADEPHLISDLSDAYILARKHGIQVDLALTNAYPSTPSDLDRVIAQRVFRLRWIEDLPGRRCLQVTRIQSAQALLRTLVVVYLHEVIEALLLLREVVRGGSCRLFLQGQVHAPMTPVLPGMARIDPFNADQSM